MGAVVWNLAFQDPTVELPAVAAPADPLPALRGLPEERVPGEWRAFVVGASMTAGYPYRPLGAASFATQLEAGLRAVFSGRTIHVRPSAKPALDSPKLAAMCDRLAARRPDLLLVVLGTNEMTNRVFSGRSLIPRGPIETLLDRGTRARRFWHLAADFLHGGMGRQRSEQELSKLVKRAFQAGPGKPAIGALPVRPEERRLLVGRMRRSMARMVRSAREHGVRLVFAIGPYDLLGSWPWGLGGEARNRRRIDRLVLRFRRDLGEVDRAELESLLAVEPEAAELCFVEGRLLHREGRFEEARASLLRARDLDPIPMHRTGEIERAIREAGRELGIPVLDLNEALSRGREDGLPDPRRFLDYGHLDLEGHAAIARWLAARFAEAGFLPDLPEGWERRFLDGARARLARALDPQASKEASVNMAWADGNFALLFGNFRDALSYLERAFRGNPDDPEIVFRLIFCADSLAGRLDVWRKGTEEERRKRILEVYRRFRKALARGGFTAELASYLESSR